MGLLKPKRTLEANDVGYGICLWRLPNGSYVQNSNGDYLNSYGRIADTVCETKMQGAVRQLGITEGKCWWMPGFRRITTSEWEDQMERLLDGRIPDPVDQWRQLEAGGS